MLLLVLLPPGGGDGDAGGAAAAAADGAADGADSADGAAGTPSRCTVAARGRLAGDDDDAGADGAAGRWADGAAGRSAGGAAGRVSSHSDTHAWSVAIEMAASLRANRRRASVLATAPLSGPAAPTTG